MTERDIHQHPLHKVVVGALRSSINDHGPITRDLIGSATKRILGAVIAAQEAAAKEEGDEAAA